MKPDLPVVAGPAGVRSALPDALWNESRVLRARGAKANGEDCLTDSFDLGPLIDEFRDEARDQIDQLDGALLTIERTGNVPDEDRSSLLRSLHTLKGNAGMLGLAAVRDFVHAVEAVVKEVRDEWNPDTVERLFHGATALRRAVEAAGGAGEAEAFAELTEVRRRLEGDQASDRGTGAAPVGAGGDGEGGVVAEDRLRVPFVKLDLLLNEVGELLGETESLVEAVTSAPRAKALEITEAVRRRTDRLQEVVLSLRLVPLGRILGRFHGLVRRLAREEGKEARLVVDGEDTEMDKSTADALAEPLLHLVRNAIDHGIESPEAREAAGKPRHGTIWVVAERDGHRVRLEVEDDGAGLDLEAVLTRARSIGLVAEDTALSDEEVAGLIFEAGLSTRRDVGKVSGRGVGLDVVRRRVQSLRGELQVGPGRRGEQGGTRFTIWLPLAVAVVPSLLFEAGGETLAVPATAVARAMRLGTVERVGRTEVVRDGDELVPLVDTGRLFQWPAEARGSYGVLLRWGRGGVVVTAERLVNQRDLVVKSLPAYGERPAGISGASVLPGGKVVLMLDPGEVVQMAGQNGQEAVA